MSFELSSPSQTQAVFCYGISLWGAHQKPRSLFAGDSRSTNQYPIQLCPRCSARCRLDSGGKTAASTQFECVSNTDQVFVVITSWMLMSSCHSILEKERMLVVFHSTSFTLQLKKLKPFIWQLSFTPRKHVFVIYRYIYFMVIVWERSSFPSMVHITISS